MTTHDNADYGQAGRSARWCRFTYSVTIEVDAAAWIEEYPEAADEDLRDSVRCSLEIAAESTGTAPGAITVVKVR